MVPPWTTLAHTPRRWRRLPSPVLTKRVVSAPNRAANFAHPVWGLGVISMTASPTCSREPAGRLASLWSRPPSRSVLNRFVTDAPHGDDTGPVGQVEIFLIVDGSAVTHLRRRLVEREAQDQCGLQLLVVGGAALGAATGMHVVDQQLER